MAPSTSLTGFLNDLRLAHAERCPCPSPKAVERWFDAMMALLFPGLADIDLAPVGAFQGHVGLLRSSLVELISATKRGRAEAAALTERFFEQLPGIHADLVLDAEATYRGDPAAVDPEEVVRSYPGFIAVAAYRVAHALHGLGVEVLPRMVSEHAHARTGIDIHPAAKIGRHLCIDHGTGIVIGETAVVGDHVKIYQGVTLGGLSVRKEDASIKRHPTVKDRVVLYAGATVLGGETVIGEGSVIGGNVWLTSSVPPNSRVVYQSRMYQGDSPELGGVLLQQEAL
ncbi:MAG: serine acetyltransferase [Trueperaceae bacterium]|nr:serine acetyltransferase [Trueperaceae bacterium]